MGDDTETDTESTSTSENKSETESESETTSLFGDTTSVPDDLHFDVAGDIDMSERAYTHTRQSRQDYPAPVSWLVETNTDRVLIDWVVEQYLDGNDGSYSKSELADKTGISRKTLGRRIDKHVLVGVLSVDDSSYYDQYYVEDTPIVRALVVLNEIVMEEYPDDPSTIPET